MRQNGWRQSGWMPDPPFQANAGRSDKPQKHMQLNIQAAQEIARKLLAPLSDTPTLDAQVLLAAILGRSRAWVMAHPEGFLDEVQADSFQQAAARLEEGEPLPYILGRREFFGLEFAVTPGVLIPRPETELLVENALGWLHANPKRRLAADIGTGSGCIAIALAANTAHLQVVAVDVSGAALAVARQNIIRHALVERVFPVQLDLLRGLHPTPHRRFDLVCANLPYIPTETLVGLDKLRREPELALHGGQAGTDLIQRMLAGIDNILAPGGRILMEIETSQGTAVTHLAQAALPGADVQLLTDLAGHDRLVIVQT